MRINSQLLVSRVIFNLINFLAYFGINKNKEILLKSLTKIEEVERINLMFLGKKHGGILKYTLILK